MAMPRCTYVATGELVCREPFYADDSSVAPRANELSFSFVNGDPTSPRIAVAVEPGRRVSVTVSDTADVNGYERPTAKLWPLYLTNKVTAVKPATYAAYWWWNAPADKDRGRISRVVLRDARRVDRGTIMGVYDVCTVGCVLFVFKKETASGGGAVVTSGTAVALPVFGDAGESWTTPIEHTNAASGYSVAADAAGVAVTRISTGATSTAAWIDRRDTYAWRTVWGRWSGVTRSQKYSDAIWQVCGRASRVVSQGPRKLELLEYVSSTERGALVMMLTDVDGGEYVAVVPCEEGHVAGWTSACRAPRQSGPGSGGSGGSLVPRSGGGSLVPRSGGGSLVPRSGGGSLVPDGKNTQVYDDSSSTSGVAVGFPAGSFSCDPVPASADASFEMTSDDVGRFVMLGDPLGATTSGAVLKGRKCNPSAPTLGAFVKRDPEYDGAVHKLVMSLRATGAGSMAKGKAYSMTKGANYVGDSSRSLSTFLQRISDTHVELHVMNVRIEPTTPIEINFKNLNAKLKAMNFDAAVVPPAGDFHFAIMSDRDVHASTYVIGKVKTAQSS